jgi:hypothetical protein
MLYKTENNKKLVYDGVEDDVYKKTFVLVLNDKTEIAFKVSDFYDNELENITDTIESTDFEKLVETGEFKKGRGGVFRGSDNLELSYLWKGEYLLILSFGETQPARYKLFFEGAWKRVPGNDIAN